MGPGGDAEGSTESVGVDGGVASLDGYAAVGTPVGDSEREMYRLSSGVAETHESTGIERWGRRMTDQVTETKLRADLALRAACIHGRYDEHRVSNSSKWEWCAGSRDITIDYEAVAKAIYKDYEGCGDSYVEQVWAWESLSGDDRASLEARDAFRTTVEEFTTTAHHAVDAALEPV